LLIKLWALTPPISPTRTQSRHSKGRSRFLRPKSTLRPLYLSMCVLRVPGQVYRHSPTLQGLGQTTFTWRAMILEGLVPYLPHVEWTLPQAYVKLSCGIGCNGAESTTRSDKPVTYSRDMRRPSWFNIATLPPGDAEFDEPAIAESIGVIESLILAQIHRGVDSRRIILVGFSQGFFFLNQRCNNTNLYLLGAALSVMVALSTLHDLGGVASLSGWIPSRARDVSIHALFPGTCTHASFPSKRSPPPMCLFYGAMARPMSRYLSPLQKMPFHS
jgi:predicted esterase